MGLVTLSYHSWVWICDAARFILLLGHTVYDIGLNISLFSPWLVHGTYYIDLVILPWLIALIHINDMIGVINTEDWI